MPPNNAAWLSTLSAGEATEVMIQQANYFNQALDTLQDKLQFEVVRNGELEEENRRLQTNIEIALPLLQTYQQVLGKNNELQQDNTALRAELTLTQNELERTRAEASANDRVQRDAAALRAELTATQNEVEKSRAELGIVKHDRDVAQKDNMRLLCQQDRLQYELQRRTSWSSLGSDSHA